MSSVLPKAGDVVADKYELIEKLGSGAFGAVYKAKQLGIDRTVAIKLLLASPDEAGGTAVARFQREATLSASLEHPNTITIHDYGQDGSGMLYLVMEYVRGDTLKERLRRDTSLDQDLATRIIRQVLSSLKEAHGRGIVHRDLKPANIMLFNRLGEEDVVKILDFGIAKFISNDEAVTDGDKTKDDLTLEGRIVGTPRYMAPEQIGGRGVCPATDLYAVGLILYEMVTGLPAVRGDSTFTLISAQLSDEHAIDITAPGLDPALIPVLVQATAKQIEDRFQGADEFLAALDAALAHSVEPADAVADPPLEPASRRSLLPLVAAAGVVVLLLAGVGLLVAAPWESGPARGESSSNATTPDPSAQAPPAQADEIAADGNEEPTELPPMREIALVTEPPQALVMREGEVIGRTPLTLALDPGAKPSFQLSLEGYVTETLEIGDQAPEPVVLKPQPKTAKSASKRKKKGAKGSEPKKSTYTAF